jgi:hypothetical protein
VEDPFAPPELHRNAGDRQVPDRHHPAVLHPGDRTALPAALQIPRCLHSEMPFTVDVLGRQHLESGQAEQGSNMVVHLGLLASWSLGGEHGS